METSLCPRKVLRTLLTIIALLTLCNLLVVIATHLFGHARLLGFAREFDFNREANIPSYFSALQIASAALILLCIARARRASRDRFARHWACLAAVFGYLSVDEAASLHEMFIVPMAERFELSGVWSLAWYIPYSLLLVGFALAFWRFFWQLPKLLRVRFVVAGSVFLFGAVGLEMLSAYIWSNADWDEPLRAFRVALSYSVEEPLEMIGIALFVHACLHHAASLGISARIAFETTAQAERQRAPWPGRLAGEPPSGTVL